MMQQGVTMHKGMLTMMFCAVLLSCSDPEGPEPLPPIKESFEWRLDTIRSPGAWMFVLNDVFGTDDGRVYVSAMGNGGWRGMLWTLQDSIWVPIELNRKYGGPLDGEVTMVWNLDGTGGPRIWLAGCRQRDTVKYPVNRKLEYGFLASYDGKSFTEIDLYYERPLSALDVVTDSDIWFGSRGPNIYHYDGVRVSRYMIPVDQIESRAEYPIDNMTISDIAYADNRVFVAVSIIYMNPYGGGTVNLTFYGENQWEIMEFQAGSINSWAGGMDGYWRSPQGTLYSGGDHIYRWENGAWLPIYRALSWTNEVFGSSDRDIWGVGQMSNVVRGVEGKWKSNVFFRLPDLNKTVSWHSGWTDGNRVFITGNPDYDSMDFGIVAHGK